MAFVDELKAVFIVVGRTVRDFFTTESNLMGRHIKAISIALALAILAAGGSFGYRSYVVMREQEAHQSFADYLQDFQLAVKADNAQEWERVVTLFGYGYTQHKGTNVAPLFLSLKADAQIKLGNTVEGIDTLQEAIDLLSKESELLPLLQTKLALIQLDAEDDALSKVGLQSLVSLARDKQNSLKDMALFYLGQYHWSQDQLDEAKSAWGELEESNWYDKAYPSPWMQEAKQKLELIAA